MSSKSKTSKRAPKTVKAQTSDTGAQLVTAPPTVELTGAPLTSVGAALAVLDAKRIETNGAPSQTTNDGAQLYVLAPPGAQSDALGGRIGGRTQLAHVVLCEAAQNATNDDLKLVSTRTITDRASSLSQTGAVKNAPSHLNTMKGRRYVVRVNGAWALSNRARKLVQLAPLAALVAVETAQYGAPTDAQ